jgi:hypothetical protein
VRSAARALKLRNVCVGSKWRAPLHPFRRRNSAALLAPGGVDARRRTAAATGGAQNLETSSASESASVHKAYRAGPVSPYTLRINLGSNCSREFWNKSANYLVADLQKQPGRRLAAVPGFASSYPRAVALNE